MSTLADIGEAVIAQTDGASTEEHIVRPTEVLGEVSLPGFEEVAEHYVGAFCYGGMMAAMGIMGPEDFEKGAREYVTALLATGIRAGQALAVGDLDTVADDLDALDDLDDLAAFLGVDLADDGDDW